MENLPDTAVDGLRLVLVIHSAVLVDDLVPCVDGGMVGLVVDQKQRKTRDERTPVSVLGIGDVVANPFEQAFEYRLVLLDDEQPRPLLGGDGEMLRDLGVEVPVV